MMDRVDLKLGFSCNNRCTFCVQGDKRDRYEDRSTEEAMAMIREAREHADSLVFTGGEVTIRTDLVELVAYARSLGFSVLQIQTNGRLLAVERCLEELVAAGVTEISPAVHGHDAATHDAQTQAKGSFRQTVKGIRNAKRRGIKVLTNTVVTRQNYVYLPEIAKLLVALRVDQFQLALVHPLGTAEKNFETVVPRLREVVPYVLEALRIGRASATPCMTEAIPLCFLPGFEEHAAEFVIPHTRIMGVDQVVEDYTATRVGEGKTKGEVCATCARSGECEGPWREYPEHYGWEGFHAIPAKGSWVTHSARSYA